MSVPQGSTNFNVAYFASLTNRINAALSCAELQSIVDNEFPSIQGVKDSITAQIALIAPILALLTAPAANPTAIVTWLSTFITSFLTPYVVPYTTMAAQQTALLAQIAAIEAAVTSAQAKFPSCTFPLPPIT
jgi:hypothetical protein